MQIDRIKISQEINFNGMPTWIGIEAALLPDEDEKDGLRKIQKIITEYQDEEQKAYTQSKWGKMGVKLSDEVQGIFDGIMNSPDLKELNSWWLKSKGNLNLSTAYKAKEKELTDAK